MTFELIQGPTVYEIEVSNVPSSPVGQDGVTVRGGRTYLTFSKPPTPDVLANLDIVEPIEELR